MNRVGFDNTLLSILLNPNCNTPTDPTTNEPVRLAKRRAEHLIGKIQKAKGKIIIPTPAVAEILTAIGPEAQEYYQIIGRNRLFEIAPFDERASIELAYLNRDMFARHDPKNLREPWQKIKFDRQIIAILKSRGAVSIYTDDVGMANRAKICGIEPIATAHLELPPDEKQLKFEFEPHEEIPEADIQVKSKE